jgi:hypothetical protein
MFFPAFHKQVAVVGAETHSGQLNTELFSDFLERRLAFSPNVLVLEDFSAILWRKL